LVLKIKLPSISRIIPEVFVVVARAVVRDKLVRPATGFQLCKTERRLIYSHRTCRNWCDLHDTNVKSDAKKELENL
jgi:hypothetical protein